MSDPVTSLRESTRALSALLRTAESDRKIPHLDWSVGQCVAHMLISNHLYASQIVGPGVRMNIEDTAELNSWSVAPITYLEPAPLADELESSTEVFLEAVSAQPASATFTWWSGAQAPIDVGVGLLVGERLVHGWDIARTLGAPWPIDPRHAAHAMSASISVMPLIVDPDAASGFDGVIEFRLRGAERYTLRFADGELTTAKADGVKPQCVISADPVSILLVGYGRISQWGPVLRGRVMAWGRKPWLAMRLPRVLRAP